MTRDWHIRPYENGDEKRILELRRVVFGDLDPVRLKESTWQWQFRDNPSGEAFCFLAESEGNIVGQYVTIPTRFSIGGKETRLAFSCDTMIHPGYRRQGMFSALARRLYDLLEREVGIKLVWGFPNDQSLPGFTGKLNWRMMPNIPLMVMPIRPLAMILRSFPPLGKLFRPPSEPVKKDTGMKVLEGTHGLHIKSIAHFDDAYETLWQEHAAMKPVIQIRDKRYLQWRYIQVPQFGYRPFAVFRDGQQLGYLVIRMMALEGRIFGVLVDVFPFPMESYSVVREIFSFAGRYVKAHGGDFLTFLLPPKQTDLLKRAGFKRVPEIINPKTWRLGYRWGGEGQPQNLDRWHITYGDTDVV